MASAFRSSVAVDQAISLMGEVFAVSDRHLLLMSTVHLDGRIGCTDCFRLTAGAPTDDVLLHLPRRQKATRLLFGSSATYGLATPAQEDLELTARLMSLTEAEGLELVEHVLYDGDAYRLMKASLSDGLSRRF